MKDRKDPSLPRSMRECQYRLALLWLGFTGLLFLIMIAQTFLGRYTEVDQAWTWFIPTLIPTVSVIIGGIVHSASTAGKDFEVEARIYNLAFVLSAVYIGLVAVTVVLGGLFVGQAAAQAKSAAGLPGSVPGPASAPKTIQTWMQWSKLWLTPLEAPVGVVLGVFFTSSRPSPPNPPGGGGGGVAVASATP